MQSALQNKLVVLSGPQSGSVIELKDNLAIGRGKNADVQLLDRKLSRRHAILEVVDGMWQLRDLGSLNGSFVNDALIDSAVPLHHGDDLRLGNIALRFFSEPQVERVSEVGVAREAEAEAVTATETLPAKIQDELPAPDVFQWDLELAGQIQHCFLPKKSPLLPGFRFAERYTAAHQIGGDYYDYVEFFKNRHGLAVGDVAGKGVSAALYMAKLSSEMRFHAQGRLSPGAVLTVLNQSLFSEMEGGMFVTLLLIMIDSEMRKLKISSAGHFPPVLRTGNQAVSELQIKRNYPIGVAENTEYQDTEYILHPGDRIVLYTDGVTEALGPKGAFFGKGRLMQAIAQGGDSPDGVLAAVSKAVAAYSAGVPQSDDLTMVCLGID